MSGPTAYDPWGVAAGAGFLALFIRELFAWLKFREQNNGGSNGYLKEQLKKQSETVAVLYRIDGGINRLIESTEQHQRETMRQFERNLEDHIVLKSITSDTNAIVKRRSSDALD